MATTVMLKDKEAELLEKARRELFYQGLGALDKDLRNEVEGQIGVDKLANLTKGSVIAIASLILINNLNKKRIEVDV